MEKSAGPMMKGQTTLARNQEYEGGRKGDGDKQAIDLIRDNETHVYGVHFNHIRAEQLMQCCWLSGGEEERCSKYSRRFGPPDD